MIGKKRATPFKRGLMHLPHMVVVTMNSIADPEPNASAISDRCWLVKFAPFRTSWLEIVRRGTFALRGTRSPAARKHLSKMRVGDPVLFYHSQQELAIVGVMEVTREAYPDPTGNDPRWLTCDFSPVRTLPRPVALAEIKADPRLSALALVRQPRLAVMPVTDIEYHIIVDELSKMPSALPLPVRTNR